MPRRTPTGSTIATTLLLEVNEMSDHTVNFESNQIGATPEGWTATLSQWR